MNVLPSITSTPAKYHALVLLSAKPTYIKEETHEVPVELNAPTVKLTFTYLTFLLYAPTDISMTTGATAEHVK